MGLLKQILDDGGLQRKIMKGDTLITDEVFPAAVTTTATTLTAAILTAGWYNRNLAANGTDTVDTAANIIAGLSNGVGTIGVPPDTSWRFSIYNSAAFTDTVTATANTGVTVNAGTVNASSVKDFLVTVVNGTPARTVNVTTTNGSAVLTNVASSDIAQLTVGMIVTSATAGEQGQTIISLDYTNGKITLSGNANATGNTAITFSPVIIVQGLGQKLI